MNKIDHLLLCDCAGSMELDPASAGTATGAETVHRCSHLCTGDIDLAAGALAAPGTVMIACAQEAGRFAELATGMDSPAALITTDIRDRAGWTAQGKAFAKQAALLAEAALAPPTTPMLEITSSGTVLILGDGDGAAALHAAQRLCGSLAVTCLLQEAAEVLTPNPEFDLALGQVRTASGALGGFALQVEGFAQALPSGRGAQGFTAPAERIAHSTCDIILDLRKGAAPLFPAAHKRDGYLRADPGDKLAIEAAIFDAAGLQGVFEKPIHVHFQSHLCAHARAGQTGCSLCLDICPTGAITASGDHVTIDPAICAGCGGCAAACPSGAVTYTDPPVTFLFTRLATLARSFRDATGDAPRLLFHDQDFGNQLISLTARHGAGLPADVIPVAVANSEGVGHAEMLAALAVGFASVQILLSAGSDRAGPEAQLAIARAIVDGCGHDPARLSLITPADPEALETALEAENPGAAVDQTILPLGERREVTRLAASALASGTPTLPLPGGAPYGAILVDSAACTLCLSCVSLCPSGALGDHPDKPQLNFQESACLQCGICSTACPENAIRLEPRLNLEPEALAARVLHEEEPFACISCGKPFGVRSTIERIAAKLEGHHPMFTGSDNANLIRMCDDCRVQAHYHSDATPMAHGTRKPVRRTEDYLKKKH